MLFQKINSFLWAQWSERSFICFAQRSVFRKRSWLIDKQQIEYSGRAKYRSKYPNDFLEGKFAVNHRAKRTIVRKIARIKTIGVTKMRGNFVKISFQAKFLRKATKTRNFVEIRLHYFCTILYTAKKGNIKASNISFQLSAFTSFRDACNERHIFLPWLFLIPQRNLIGEDFDHVLGNHFWTVSRASHNQQNNAL